MNGLWLPRRVEVIAEKSGSVQNRILSAGDLVSTVVQGGIATAGLWAGIALAASTLLLWKLGLGDLADVQSSGLLLSFFPATISYLLRFLRWHILLQRTFDPVPLSSSFLVQAIGFALGATPGRAGELLKLHLLKRHCRVSAVHGGAVLLFERLSDAVGFGALAAVGALLVSQESFAGHGLLRYGAIIFGILVLATVVARRGEGMPLMLGGRLRGVGVVLAEFLKANRTLLLSSAAPWAAILSISARLCDALIVYIVAQSLGLPLSYPQAILVFGMAGLAGGISPLPGGIGTAEATMTGFLVGLGTTASVGLAIALIVRMLTYWLWVALGLVALAIYYGSMKGGKDAGLPGLNPS